MMKQKNYLPNLLFFIILLLCFIVYIPGLQGGFLFDDHPNLGELEKYGDLSVWQNAQKFIMGGFSGPTGRPISLATFLINAESWPHDAKSFKLTNLFIHLLCGVLLYQATKLLLVSYGYIKEKAVWIAFLSVSLWLLHPFFVSTTLYVIQRMAQLPMLFGLIGIIGYLKGRALIANRTAYAYFIMTLSIGLATLLATFSKENGALLPLLILIIEFCNPLNTNKPVWYWRAICLWIPSIAIVLLLVHYIDFSENVWSNRSFNQVERLWSEGRIVTNYLWQLFIPRIEGQGLFQDGYYISKGWLTPLTTLYSILFILCAILASLYFRKKYPLISLALLFFFSAHLIESTVIGLELYFEHRNYVAATFLFLPLASGIISLYNKIKPSLVVFISSLLIVTLAFMTWQRAILWSDSDKLQLYWAQKNPDSERGQSLIARYLIVYGNSEEALRVLDKALAKKPNSGLLAFQRLLYKIDKNVATEKDFVVIENQIPFHKADPQAIFWLRDVVIDISSSEAKASKYASLMLTLLDTLNEKNSRYLNIPEFGAMTNFLKGMLYTALQQPEKAYQKYQETLKENKNIDMGLSMVADLGNHGYRELALQLLDQLELTLRQKPTKDLIQTKEFYYLQINRLRENIQQDITLKQNALAQ
ncbi:hypothetical protein [Acinetobacter junii]|uniref:hypothetical protein n=1 Tax=Acinetobacter junii TaxID=40215 RepID=UPI003A8905BA